MKGILIALTFLLLSASAASAFVMVNHFWVPEHTYVESQTDALAQFDFEDNAKDSDVKVVFTIPELGVRASQGPYSPAARRFDTVFRTLDIPADAEPGQYVVRMTVRDDEGNTRVIHRFIDVE
jgi:hypothetical protein